MPGTSGKSPPGWAMISAVPLRVSHMKTIVVQHSPTAAAPGQLVDRMAPLPPAPQGHQLCIAVQAVSVNPVDTKLRRNHAAGAAERILGFDAAGTVLAVGPEAEDFDVGDRVYYAGDITQPGSNAQWQLVDSRLVAPMPTTLDFAQAAALPLVTLTAWELLFCRMPFQLDCSRARGKHLLVIGGAGGVGSMAIQLARHAGFRVTASASREASQQWCRQLGAEAVVNHSMPLGPQVRALGIEHFDVVLNLADTDAYWEQIGELIAPQGHVGLIVEPKGALRIGDPYKAKSVSLHWEFMFTRSRFATADMAEQHRILKRAASLVDAGVLQTPHTRTIAPINAGTLAQAHALVESGQTIGKLTLAGWD